MSFALLIFIATLGVAAATPAWTADQPLVAVQQGAAWNTAKRDEFYVRDQGSRIMPLRWMMALKLPDGSSFLADSLQRYGFLANKASPAMLPVGFSAAGAPGHEFIGMTCAACHTRQIEVRGTAYRIDGGPAFIDLQSFLGDLDASADKTLHDEATFAEFARAVLGGARSDGEETALRQAVSDWHFQYSALMRNGLPANVWGVGRIDAVGTIFNRLTGLDLGTAPHFIIKSNIRSADAPVRHPFLWNAAKQDRTQWLGFARNDGEIFALLRNIAQLVGVFADFHPRKDATRPSGVDYLARNSVDFDGLGRLERLMADIGPPAWPWDLDEELAERGKEIYRVECNTCHRNEPGNPPWKTSVHQIGTDSRALDLLKRTAKFGVLQGIIRSQSASSANDGEDGLALDALTTSTVGMFCQREPFVCRYATPDVKVSSGVNESGYEAKVLHGIWAAAPYLHNGSVPTLADLLKPAAERTASFPVGRTYDPIAVGLAREQTQLHSIMTTTDCSAQGSGNSRCGHEFGVDLPDADKWALLEYLKKL